MSAKVLSTTNYSRFKMMDGNRHINNGRVKKLIKSVKRKNMLAQFPIVCMKNCTGLYVMDGQHRLEAAKELKLPIYYIEAKNLEIADVAVTNSAQKGWSSTDFVNSFADQGNADYIKLRNFHEEHGLPITTCANILAGHFMESGGVQTPRLVQGTFKIQNWDFANQVAAAVKATLAYFPAAKDRGFVIAIARLLSVKGFAITRFIMKLETQSTKLVKCASWLQYVELIEEIYNYRARGGDLIPLVIEVKKGLTK